MFFKTTNEIENYIKGKKLFGENDILTIENLREVKNSVEGYINPIYRIRNASGKSVIMKLITQIPVSREEDTGCGNPDHRLKDWFLDCGRIHNEIAVLLFWNAIYPGICPDVYFVDEQNGIIIMEDLSHLSLLRYEMARRHKQKALGETLGCFFARNLFYSSNLFLTQYRRNELLTYFENPEYNALEQFLFSECTIVSPHRYTPEETMPLRLAIIENPDIQKEIKRLNDLFINDKECLIHTDLHSSNTLVDFNDVRIIDTEFAGFGPIAQDFGRFSASFCLNYLSWCSSDNSATPKEKAEYQEYVLSTLETLYASFEEEFKSLCEKHMSESYTLRHLNISDYLKSHFIDSMSYTALNAASRIGGRGLCYDLGRLSPEDRIRPIMLVLHLCEDILSKKVELNTITDLTAYLRELPQKH